MIEVGQKFGKYRLLDRLAIGGMAEIFKAAAPSNGSERLVAIKRLHKSICDDAELTKMLIDEARISVLLDHPNIAQIFDLGQINGQFYIVMQYIDGVDVHDILEEMKRRREFMPIPAALHIMSETLQALHYAHNQVGPDGHPLNIVHRDVSPQNIMVGFDGQIRLVDFGIAKARKRAQTTQAGVIKGKFYYMAPEQAHGSLVDARTDVFSAGMVLYEMLTALSPYDHVSDAELLKAVRMADVPPLSSFRPDLDPGLERIIMTAIERDSSRRYASAQEFRYALDQYAKQMYPPVNHEEQMAHFVANLFGRPVPANLSRMSRDDFRATDESLIFDGPDMSVIQQFREHRDFAEQRPFESDATAVWDQNRAQNFVSSQPTQGEGQNSSTHADLPSHRLPPSPHTSRPEPAPFAPASATPTSEQRPMSARLKSPNILYGAIGLVLLMIGGLVVVLLMKDEKPQTIAAKEVAAARVDEGATSKGEMIVHLALNSVPTNAQVAINGTEKGSTPLSVPVKSSADYKIEITRPGYEPWVQTVRVADSEAEPIEAKLEEARGLLKISSFPPEATITIDGKEIGDAPVTHGPLSEGKMYEVAAELDGERQMRQVKWRRSDGAIVDIMFELEEPPAAEEAAVAVEAAKPVRKPTRRRPPRRRAPKPEPEPEPAESLSVWGDSDESSDSEQADEEVDEDLNVWGSSSKKKTKKKKEPKAEEKLDIW